MKPTYREKNLLDYLFGGFRSTLQELPTNRFVSGIQFTTHFIDFFVVQTKRFVGSCVHVILMRQTCGQRSSKAAES